MTIKTFDRAAAQAISDELDAALAVIAEKHGIQLRSTSIRFAGDHLTASIEAQPLAESGSGITATAATMAEAYGLDINRVGPGGERLVDYNPRARKMPWVFSRPDGRRFKCEDGRARQLFGKAA